MSFQRTTSAFGRWGGFASVDAPCQTPPDGLIVPCLTLPDDKDLPAEVTERFFVAFVAGAVPDKFFGPERDAGPG